MLQAHQDYQSFTPQYSADAQWNHQVSKADDLIPGDVNTATAVPSAPRRSRRPGKWCWLDTAVILTYGPRIGAHALAVYLVLATHANGRTQTCYPSIKTIARLTHLGRSTVKNALRTLRGEGLIQSTSQRDPLGDPTSNLYTLLDPTPATVAPLAAVPGGGRSGDDRPPVTTEPTGRSSGDPEPTKPFQQEERTSKSSDGRVAKGKEDAKDETSSWDKRAVPLPLITDRPDDLLAAEQLSPEAYARLAEEATAEMVAEGAKAFSLCTPTIEAKMVAILEGRRAALTVVEEGVTPHMHEETAPCAAGVAA
jgi:hypothetical protein